MNLLCDGDLRESAIHYIKQGNLVVPGVLKMVDGEKVTKRTRWKELKHCLFNEKNANTFFDKYKQTNSIAIRCDKLTVIDIDNHDGQPAIKQLEMFCERIYGTDYVEEVYATCTQYSLRGGIHLIFQNDPDLTKMELRDLMRVDIDIQTSRTSLITMSPTSLDGKKYNMVCGEVLPFPYRIKEFILSLREARQKQKDLKFRNNMNRLDNRGSTVNEEAYMEKVLSELGTLSEGNRNDKLFRGCCAWIKKLSPKNCFDLLDSVNRKFVAPPLDDIEIQTIFDQAVSLGGVR